MIEKIMSDFVKKVVNKQNIKTSYKKTIFKRKIDIKTKNLQEPLSF